MPIVGGLLSRVGGEVFRRCPPPGLRDAATDAHAGAWPKRLLASGTHSDSVQLTSPATHEWAVTKNLE